MDGPPPDDLAGTRLGKVERYLLRAAAHPATYVPLRLDAEGYSRSARESLHRSARRLSELGLLDLESMRIVVRAHDPRRAHPVYRGGEFWERSETTRRHVVRSLVAWLTPLGFGVARAYDRELRRGLRIRWTERKLAEARETAQDTMQDRLTQAQRRHYLRHCERVTFGEASTEVEVERVVVPDHVETEQARARWSRAVACARRSHPNAGSVSLWSRACQLYDSGAELPELKIFSRDPFSTRPLRTETDDLLSQPRKYVWTDDYEALPPETLGAEPDLRAANPGPRKPRQRGAQRKRPASDEADRLFGAGFNPRRSPSPTVEESHD